MLSGHTWETEKIFTACRFTMFRVLIFFGLFSVLWDSSFLIFIFFLLLHKNIPTTGANCFFFSVFKLKRFSFLLDEGSPSFISLTKGRFVEERALLTERPGCRHDFSHNVGDYYLYNKGLWAWVENTVCFVHLRT